MRKRGPCRLLECPPERRSGHEKACDGWNARGCSGLAYMYQNGAGVAKDEGKAVQLYQQACNGGEARGCYNLGVMYEKGQGVTQDQARAAQLYQKACDGGTAEGCSELGDVRR